MNWNWWEIEFSQNPTEPKLNWVLIETQINWDNLSEWIVPWLRWCWVETSGSQFAGEGRAGDMERERHLLRYLGNQTDGASAGLQVGSLCRLSLYPPLYLLVYPPVLPPPVLSSSFSLSLSLALFLSLSLSLSLSLAHPLSLSLFLCLALSLSLSLCLCFSDERIIFLYVWTNVTLTALYYTNSSSGNACPLLPPGTAWREMRPRTRRLAALWTCW